MEERYDINLCDQVTQIRSFIWQAYKQFSLITETIMIKPILKLEEDDVTKKQNQLLLSMLCPTNLKGKGRGGRIHAADKMNFQYSMNICATNGRKARLQVY